jgi:hypothetical protein
MALCEFQSCRAIFWLLHRHFDIRLSTNNHKKREYISEMSLNVILKQDVLCLLSKYMKQWRPILSFLNK